MLSWVNVIMFLSVAFDNICSENCLHEHSLNLSTPDYWDVMNSLFGEQKSKKKSRMGPVINYWVGGLFMSVDHYFLRIFLWAILYFGVFFRVL